MSDTISKYWEDNDTFPEGTKKEWTKKMMQKLFDSNPEYNGELDEVRERPKLNKTAYRILSEYDEKDILQAAYIIRRTNSDRGLEWDVTD